jgi:RimJ/RimL family protein N-acetyltransferase
MGTVDSRSFAARTGEPFVVRAAQASDAEGVLAVSLDTIRERVWSVTTPEEFTFTPDQEVEYLARHMEDPNELAVVADHGDEVIGFLGLEAGPRKALRHRCTLHLAVAKGWRGRGVGGALITTALDWCRARPDVTKVSLAVLADNQRAIALYERLGFAHEGRRPREVRRGPDEYVDDVLMYLFV